MPSGIYKHKKHTEETKKKMSESLKGKKNALGYKHTKEALDKIRKAGKGRHTSTEFKKRKNHPFYKGDDFDRTYPLDWTDILRESIRQKDNYVCQLCGTHQDELNGRLKKLDIHHIDYDKDNLNPENLISLCRSCHIKTNYNRNYWINYFKQNV